MSEHSPDGRRRKRFVTTVVEVEGREETKIVELPDAELPPWDDDSKLRIVGQPIPRVDAREKVTGRARYTADVVRPGMLYAVLLRSPIAAGTLTAIDMAAARSDSQVIDAIGPGDVPKIRVAGTLLFDRNISYVGQPIAAICAESLAAARAGGDRMMASARFERRAHAVTFSDAVADGAPVVRSSGNVSKGSPNVVERGDVESGLREADVIVRREYRTPSALHTSMEPHGAVAEWEGDRLTVWESTQGVFRVRDEIANAFSLPRSSVRVLKDHMGGGFGSKNNAGAYTFAAVHLARRTGRAVRCVLDRYGEQVDSGHRPEARIRVTLGARRDGTLTAIVGESDVSMGTGGWDASPTAIFHELYACANVRTTDVFAWVHSQAMAAFRAPGHVEGAFALERAMDALAAELPMERLQLRRCNVPGRDQEKQRPYSADALGQCLDEGARRFGWRAEGAGSTDDATGGRRLRGVGCAAQIWGAGGGPPAYATVRVNSDGTADILSGTQDLGTGARTILAQIGAESLGARFADVRVILGDTERTPYAGNSWGSMTTASVGPAIRAAGEDAQRRLREAAAEMLECHPDDLVAQDSVVTTRDGARSLSFADVAKKLGNVMIMGQGSRGPNSREVGLVSVGAQFAEVEVDAETGHVRVTRIVAVHDAGRIINPLLAQSQLEGGIIQGLGFALFEDRVVDPTTGIPLNPGMHDYKIPTLGDLPTIDATCLDVPDAAANAIGARGLAEPPIIPTAAAIANAVSDALGVEVNTLPLSPRRVLEAIRSAYA